MKQHKSKTRIVAGLSVATASALLLTACGSSDEKADGGATSASTEKVTLTYSIWNQEQQPAMEAIGKAYTEKHPNVTVDVQLVPNSEYWTKLQTSLTGGAGPDVFWMNGPNFPLYASNKQLASLEGEDIDPANYSKGLVDLYTMDGTLYGAPKDFDTVAVWYNKALFDAAGAEYPKPGWTWDDFKAAAAKTTNKEKGVWGIAAANYTQTFIYDTIVQAGGKIISDDKKTTGYNTPEALAGVNFWLDLIKDGSSPTGDQMVETSPPDLFSAGKVAMFWDGSWSPGAYAKNETIGKTIDLVELPKGPAGNQSIIHGLATVANANSKHVNEAKSFAAFAGSEEAALIQAKSGAVIPAFNGTQQTWVDAFPQYKVQTFIDALETAVPYPSSKNTSVWNTAEGEIFAQIWSGKQSAEDGLAELATKMQAALDAEQK